MEAATTLRPVTVFPDRIVVNGLTITDTTVLEFVRAADDPVRSLLQAIETGARVLDREQVGATVEIVQTNMEQSTNNLAASFAKKFDEANDKLASELERLFSDGSAGAVQHKIRAAVEEAGRQNRDQIVRQFSSADASNPLADFKNGVLRVTQQQVAETVAMREQVVELRAEVARLHAEKEKATEVAAEHHRSTAKGRPYEEAVFDAMEAIAGGHGDLAEPVGDAAGMGGRKGDVVVGIEGCAGPPRGRIVVEAKHSQTSRNAALAYLDEAMSQRDADYGIWVVPSEDVLPARTTPLREAAGDKVFVVYDPLEGSDTALRVAYAMARFRVMMARNDTEGLDSAAVRAVVERAVTALEEERRMKGQLTNATTAIENAREILTGMGETVRAHLAEIDRLVVAGDQPAPVVQRRMRIAVDPDQTALL